MSQVTAEENLSDHTRQMLDQVMTWNAEGKITDSSRDNISDLSTKIAENADQVATDLSAAADELNSDHDQELIDQIHRTTYTMNQIAGKYRELAQSLASPTIR